MYCYVALQFFLKHIILKNTDTSSGLSHNTVKAIYQDKIGRLWLGTFDGLSIYDGEEFNNYSFSKGLKSSVISCFYELNDSIMLVGTGINGIYVFCKTHAGKDTILKNYSGKKYLISNGVNKILKDWNNNYWICTDSGLTKWSYNKAGNSTNKLIVKHFGKEEGFPGTFVYGTVDYKNKILWLGTTAGLVKSDGIKFVVEKGEPTKYIFSIYADSDSLVLGTMDKILSYKNRSFNNLNKFLPVENFKSIHGLTFFNIMKDTRSNYLFTSLKGLMKFDGKSFSIINHNNSNLKQDFYVSVYEDIEGDIWIGSVDGLYKYTYDSFSFLNGSDKLAYIKGMITDKKEELWVVTNNSLYKIKNNRLLKFKYNSIIRNCIINNIAFTDSNNLWVGTNEGIFRFRNTGAAFKNNYKVFGVNELAPGYSYKIVSDKENNIWVLNSKGKLFLIQNERMTNLNQNKKFEHFKFPDNVARCMFADANDNIWIGYFNEDLIMIGKDSVKQFSEADGLPAKYIMTIYEDHQSNIWIGSIDNGAYKYSNGRFSKISFQNRLNNDRVRSIIEDKQNNLWFVTSGGIIRYNGISWKIYDEDKGIKAGELNYSVINKYGTLYFSTIDGIYYHNPEIESKSVKPKIRIKKFEFINGKKADFRKVYPFTDSILFTSNLSTDSIQSPHKEFEYSYYQNSFSFQFISTSLKNEEKNLYTYILEGFDKNWSQLTKRNYVNYVNLPAGEYTFKVKTKNNDGLMSYPAELSFIITPPFWETWWFRILAFFFLVSVVAIITTIINRYRLAQALKIEKMRTKIATDLHDDIGTSLSSIAIFSQLAKRKIPGSTGQVDSYLERIEKTSRNLIDAMSDIVWSINPNNDSLEDAVLKMEDYAVKLLEAKGIEVQVVTPREWENINLPLETRRNLLLIFKEIVTNTAKHSNAEKVKIEFNLIEEEHRNKKIIIKVEDSGVGFDVNKTYSGNGLKNLRSRAKSINGEISITSDKKNGSVYLFSLIIKN